MENSRRSDYKAAYIFCIISCCTAGISLIMLAWLIPMTLQWKKAMNSVGTPNETSHGALGACTLIFANFIGGICGLVGNSNFKKANK